MNRRFGRGRKKNWQETMAVLTGTVLLSLVLEMWRELHGFTVRRCRIKLPCETMSGEAVKIAFLSDLHGKCYGKCNRELLDAIKREQPDYILVGGDMLTRNREATDKIAIELLSELVKLCPVYLANGNHEQKMRLKPEEYEGRYEAYMRKVRKLGIQVLVNESGDCKMKGMPVTISGLELPLGCYAHFHTRELKISDIEERIGKADGKNYQILLAHSPVYFETYAKWGADLILSGHLHGGVIGVPGLGGLITPQARLFPRYSGGTYQKGRKVSIVSRGLGTHTVNIRLFNPAELLMITLQPKNFSCIGSQNQV